MTEQSTPAPTSVAIDGLIEKVSRDIFVTIESVGSLETLESFGSMDDYEMSLRYAFRSSGGSEGTIRYASPLHYVASKVSAAGQPMSTSSWASLPPPPTVDPSTTWGSLPAFGTASSLESLPECGDAEVVEPTVDLEHWGIDALSRFGYRLDEVIGDLSLVGDDESSDGSATTAMQKHPTKAMLWRATRLADGKVVLVKGVTSIGELPAAAKQAVSNEFKVFRALRGEAVLVAEALLCTRFDAWLILECAAGSAVQARFDSGGNPAGPAAAEVFVQLLQGLTRLAPPPPSCDEVTPGLWRHDMCDAQTKTLIASNATHSCAQTAATADQAHSAQRKRFERADVWAKALNSYANLWDSLPHDLQEQAAASVMKSHELAALMVPDGSSVALLNLFVECQAVDLRVRPSAAELLRHPALTRG